MFAEAEAPSAVTAVENTHAALQWLEPLLYTAGAFLVLFGLVRMFAWPLSTTTGGSSPGGQRIRQVGWVIGGVALLRFENVFALLALGGNIVSKVIDSVNGLIA